MIEPAAVTLAGNESVRFHSDGTEWALSPDKGTFNSRTRTYKSPPLVWNSRKVFLTAYDPANPGHGGTAEINLVSSLSWLGLLAVYWPVMFVALLLWGWANWPGTPAPPLLMVNPPAVTVGKGQTQQFSASLNDVPELDVTWSATSGVITPNGFFSPPALADGQKDQTVTVTATRNSDKTRAASAIVIVSPGPGLFLYPALSHARRNDTVPLTGDGGNVNIDWPATAPNGRYAAPNRIDRRQWVNISITDKNNPGHVAGARVLLLPDSENSRAPGSPTGDNTLLGLALAAGALGAWLASVKSFVSFTGTRSFVPSWGLFYLFRPAFGAGLALVGHMAHASGSIGSAASAADPKVVVFYSALIGLFADEALQKLHDVFCALFGVQDKRTDKMGEKAPPTGPTPAITVANASVATGHIDIEGGNFASLPTVLVNNVAKTVTFINDKKLRVALDAGTAVGADLEIKVRNPDGKESAVYKTKVKA